MKRIQFFLCVLLLARFDAQAQGTISFFNNTQSAITNGLTSTRAAAGPAFKAALFYAPDAANPPVEAEFIQVGDGVPLGPSDGLFVGRTAKTPASTPPGAAAYFQVRVWETAYGATYADAVAAPAMNGRPALRGASPIMRIGATGDSAGAPPTMPASLLQNGLSGFTLTYPGMGDHPLLSITRSNLQAILAWTADPAFELEVSPDLSAGLWNVATNRVSANGDERSVVLDIKSGQSFYRLRKP